MTKKWRRVLSHDIGIDLGTANTLVHLRGEGIVINQPSVVAINQKTSQVIAIGEQAKDMIGKTPKGIIAARPLVDGVVSDFEITEEMLKHFVSQIHNDYSVIWPRPRMVIGLPSGITEVERRAVEHAALNAGAREIHLVEEPMAGAIGCGIDVLGSSGAMIVDIGGGTTEVAVIALGGIVVSRSLRVAGDELTEAVLQHIKDNFNLAIGEATAERIKCELGSVYPEESQRSMQIRGRNIITGLPQEITILAEHIRSVLLKQIRPIVEAVRTTIEEAPPELVADILGEGIILTGGGALLRGLDQLIIDETKVKTRSAPNALTAVVEGTGYILEDVEKFKPALINDEE